MEDRGQHFQDSGDLIMHGRRLTPTPQQWQSQMQAAAPMWAAIRQRQEQSEQAKQARQKRLWEGFSVDDVVILGPDVTKRSYGLSLCDDNGEAILMDGVLTAIEGEMALVNIKRLHGKPAPGRGPMVGELQWIGRKDVLRVSDQPATIWGDGLAAVKAAAARDRSGMSSRYQQFWNSSPLTGGQGRLKSGK